MMRPIPNHIKAYAYCPACQERLELTHWDGEDFDLRPVYAHIVRTHPELRDNRHVPNVRIQWEVAGSTDQ